MTIEIKVLEPALIAYYLIQGSHDQLTQAVSDLLNWAAAQGYGVAGDPVCVYLSDPRTTAEDDLLTEVRVPIITGARMHGLEGYGVREEPALMVASATYDGPREEAHSLSDALHAWAAEQGYPVAGLLRAVWGEGVTEVQLPVKPPGQGWD